MTKVKIEFKTKPIILASKNDPFPTALLDKKTLKKLRKIPFIQRNELIQNAIARGSKVNKKLK